MTNQRDLSLDAFRGLTVILMIIVNLQGGPHWQVGADAAALQLQTGWQRQGLQLHCWVIEISFPGWWSRRSTAVSACSLERSGYFADKAAPRR